MSVSSTSRLVFVCLALTIASSVRAADQADLILHSGKVVTVDRDFTIAEALAVKDGRLIEVGSNDSIMRTQGPNTKSIDLSGRMVLPGLIDSHVHAVDASMVEFNHPIPDMETIADVLAYIRARSSIVPKGAWIVVRQIFVTRLREQRYPTKAELDQAAPEHPVAFITGPDASVNSSALAKSGIDKDFRPADGGIIERDASGEPNGILRSSEKYLKIELPANDISTEQRDERLIEMLRDYNKVGITSVIDRSVSQAERDQYQRLKEAGRLSVRAALSWHVDTAGRTTAIQDEIRRIARDPLVKDDETLRIIGIKTFLDGGMLTGSAYMREPWGVSRIYGITDPAYRGLRYIPEDALVEIVRTTVENDLQFTAHSVGDGAVHALLDAYEKVSESMPVSKTRCCITHSNFMSHEAIDQARRLGVTLDIQPAWLYLDSRTLVAQFGYDRLRYFQPLHSIFSAGVICGGGSDHMQKVGSLRAINPYNPFLGMWIAITRQARWYEGTVHPEEALTREQAIRFYTSNNAYLMRMENRLGSLEKGKLADFIVVDRDLITCPIDELKDAEVTTTFVGGKVVSRG